MRQKLKIENPAMADEWDYEKNKGLDIDDYTGGSNKYVWWRCAEHNHSWYAQINKRFSRRQGCRICGNQEVLVGFNDIATTHPRLVTEWNYKKNGNNLPQHYTKGADVKIWWVCGECGYEWEAVLYSRTSIKSTGCPCCAGNILVVGKNDLQTVNPALALQWDSEKNNGLRARNVAANDNHKAWWLDELGHSWQASVSSRNQGKGCPYCSNRLLLRGFNDVASRNAALTIEWDYDRNEKLTPRDVIYGTHNYAWWKCKFGHSWRARISNRANGDNCPYCEHRIVSPGETDLMTIRSDVADAWDYGRNYPLTPDQVTAWSKRIVWWLCKKCGQSYLSSVSNRKNSEQCPYCSGKRPIVGKTDFATVHPELLCEWDFKKNTLPPAAYTRGSSKHIWWKCAYGHSWHTAISNRHYGSNCPVCETLKDKHIIMVGINDLASQNPEIAAQWDDAKNKDLTAEQVMPGSNVKVWWLCKRRHSWQASVLSRTLGTKCPRCNGKTPMQTHFMT